MNIQPQFNGAQTFVNHLLALKLSGGMIGPRVPPPPRRWQLREAGKLPPHTHARQRERHLRQLRMIEAKKAAARTIERRHSYPTPSKVRREIREFPHVYL